MNFEYQKAVQAINFFARQFPGKHISKLHVLKLVFLADRYHLRKYGRLITNDSYLAMSYGPVASSVKDIAEQSEFLCRTERAYASNFFNKADPTSHSIRSIKEYDKTVFSQTDIEALQFVINSFRHVSIHELVDFTHQFPEWKKHENKFTGVNTRADMNLLDFFEKAPAQVEYCVVPDELVELNR